jgi:hypothetical protein
MARGVIFCRDRAHLAFVIGLNTVTQIQGRRMVRPTHLGHDLDAFEILDGN